MPRLMKFEMQVKTGCIGTTAPIQISVNGHALDLPDRTGGTAAGEVLNAEFAPMSYIHELTLRGPCHGTWEIEEITMCFHCDAADPYTIRWRGTTLDPQTTANLWAPQPAMPIDV